jgi:hypothetical protein
VRAIFAKLAVHDRLSVLEKWLQREEDELLYDSESSEGFLLWEDRQENREIPEQMPRISPEQWQKYTELSNQW